MSTREKIEEIIDKYTDLNEIIKPYRINKQGQEIHITKEIEDFLCNYTDYYSIDVMQCYSSPEYDCQCLAYAWMNGDNEESDFSMILLENNKKIMLDK